MRWLVPLLLAAPAAAQELTLPSGHRARLFDVVLETASGAIAPDAGVDYESSPDAGDAGDGPLAVEEAGAATDVAPGGVARFRLVVEGLGGEGLAYADVAGDLPWLCEALALPALEANGWSPREVSVSLSDRELPFGATDPEAVQFFEGYRIEDGACVPQAF